MRVTPKLLTPNLITLLSLPLSILSALFLYQGFFLPAALLIALTGGCDLLDGVLAKKKGLATPFGAFLDSTIDRIAELFIFMGILSYFLKEEALGMVTVTFWAMGGSFVISYARARAENFIENCRVGFWERPERILLILLGLFAGRLATSLWILAFGSTLTALHRIRHTRRVLQQSPPPRLAEKILFWDFPRQSGPYSLYALLVIVLTFSL